MDPIVAFARYFHVRHLCGSPLNAGIDCASSLTLDWVKASFVYVREITVPMAETNGSNKQEQGCE